MDDQHLQLRADALLVGAPQPLGSTISAIAKQPVEGSVAIGWLGLKGDHQADRVHHGGWDKAVHIYPMEHHAVWQTMIGGHRLLGRPGAFGENIATWGATEADVCLGDRFALGSAILEVSHGRQPCAKLNERFGDSRMLAAIIANGRCGYYCRVITQGTARAGDLMTLIARPHPDISIARLFKLLIGGGHRTEPDAVAMLADLPTLAEAWRSRAAALALGR